MENEQRDMSMVLVKFTDGPLGGQERQVQNADMLVAEYPGYSATEQVLDPKRGQCVEAQWAGDEAAEASYGDSEQERERYGNQTGVRDQAAQDQARNKDGSFAQTNATGAEKRETKADTKTQVKDRRDTK